MAENEKKTITQKIDLKTFESLAFGAEENDPQTITNISARITTIVKEVLSNQIAWVNDFKELVNSENYQEAVDLLKINKGSLLFIHNANLLDYLLSIKIDSLNVEQRQMHIVAILNSVMMEKNFGKVENIVDVYLQKGLDGLPPNLKQVVNLAKANAAAKNEKYNVANTFYKKVISNEETSSIDKAFALRGMGLISVTKEDIAHYFKLSSDKFLEAGHRKDAIIDILHVSSTYENDDPNEALKLIDSAISIWVIMNELDKELLASLYHRKSRYLLSLNKKEEALVNAEKACELREKLIGNEHEQHASYSLAMIICERLGNKEKATSFSQKANAISVRITSEEFRLQNAISEAMSNDEGIVNPLLEEIEKSKYKNLIFSAYTYNATVKSFSDEDKINYCDKAKNILTGEHYTNEQHSLLYFTLAEVFRKQGEIKEAIENYELSLEFNPFYYLAIQNCGALLWNNKQWSKSRDFFKKQILKLGESSTLCYCLGRSFYELGHYQEAFDYFRKVGVEFKGADIDKFISLCLEKSKGLKIQNIEHKPFTELPPISLNDFREALEGFAKSVSANSRMHFWALKDNDYKWTSNPEEEGKQLLINVLQVKFGLDGIEILQEVRAGAGIMDLYIKLRGGLKIVLELKICGGSGYSSNYAISGTDQLIHYLQNKGTYVGFLIVFDGRRRDFNKGFIPVQVIEAFTIYTVTIDMNPKISSN